MDRLADLLRDARATLRDAADQARQDAEDSGTDDSPLWQIATDLDEAEAAVDTCLDNLPEED